MNLQELTRLASTGEGPSLEFKKKVPQPARLAKEVIAFANTNGGRVLIGVDDDGTISGLRDAIEEEYALRDALERHCDPPIEFTTERVPISNKREVLVVRVPASEDRPHFLVTDDAQAKPTAYVRIASMSIEASREAVRLMRRREDERGVLFEFGDKERLLMRYLEAYGRITVAQFAALASIPLRRASQTLVLLARARLLEHHADPREDFFALAYIPDPTPGTPRR